MIQKYEPLLKDIVGQTEVIDRLRQFAALYRQNSRSRRIDNVLLLGRLGSGRATIASAFARENRARPVEVMAESLQNAEQLYEHANHLGGRWLILRELHKLRRPLVPVVSKLMGTFVSEWVLPIGYRKYKGTGENRILPFTCVATATKESDCHESLLRLFPLHLSLRPYSETELRWIAARLAWRAGLRLEPSAALLIARMSDSPGGAETLVGHLKLLGKIAVSGADAQNTLAVFELPFEQERRVTSAEASKSGIDFERRVTALLKAMGFRAEMTKATGDGGVDVEAVLEGDSLRRGRYIVQCKRFGEHRLVGVKTVRELYGVLTAAPGVVKGVLITNTGFTGQAREFARGKRLELIDGTQLRKLLSSHGL